MWIQKRQRDNRRDIHSKTASGECQELKVDLNITKAFDAVCHDGLENHGKITQIHSNGAAILWWHAGTCAKS